jgi:hypothetical protein
VGKRDPVGITGVARVVSVQVSSAQVPAQVSEAPSIAAVARIVNVDPQPCVALGELAVELYDAGRVELEGGGGGAELGGLGSPPAATGELA